MTSKISVAIYMSNHTMAPVDQVLHRGQFMPSTKLGLQTWIVVRQLIRPSANYVLSHGFKDLVFCCELPYPLRRDKSFIKLPQGQHALRKLLR